MTQLISLALLAIFSVCNADVEDVTSVIRLRETDVGDEFIHVDDCFGQARTCPWHRSGWEVKNPVDECKPNLLTDNPLVPAKQLSPWIPVDSNQSNHTAVVTIEPTSPNHAVQVYLFADGDDGEMKHTSMVMLTLSSDGKHEARVCHRGQQTGDEQLILANSVKISRKCTSINDMFLKKEGPPPDPAEGSVFYQFEFNSGTGEWDMKTRVGCISESLIQPGHGLPVYAKYLRLISNDNNVRFTRASLGLFLKDNYGELVSRDIKVTPSASRLCLSVGVTRNVFTTELSVAVRAKDGRQIDFESLDGKTMEFGRTWRKIHFWNYVADLTEFENRTVDVRITARSRKPGNLFISSITQCKDTAAGAHQMTVIRQSATLEIHNNEPGDSAPFILPNYGVLGPNAEVATQCIATLDGCLEWTGFNDTEWIVKSDAFNGNSAETPRLTIGLQRNSDAISDDVTPSRQFVDAVEIILHDIHDVGEQNSPRPDYFRVVLLDEYDSPEASTVYVVAIGLSESNSLEAPVLYKCYRNSESPTEKVILKQSLVREDCKKLADGKLPSDFATKATEELRLQIAVETTDSSQDVKVFYFPDSTKEGKHEVLSQTDSTPIKMKRYLLSSATEDFVYATSYGIGNVFYSLDVPTTEVSSPFFPAPENGKICLALDYFWDGDDGQRVFEAKAFGSEENEQGEWAHATLIGQLVDTKTEVYVNVTFNKPDNGRFLLQRISFCHGDEATAIYEGQETIPVSIFHPGARLALPIRLPGVVEAKTCQNGGEIQSTGCDCPAGFSGTECEIGCGPNRYGGKCQNLCSFSTRGCRGMLMGRPYLGFNCAPGFGGPLCDAKCVEGVTYGAGCLQKCGRCADNTTCDAYTGYCPHGCQPGMIPPHCQREYVHVTSPPTVKVTQDSAELEFDLRNRTDGIDARFWQVQYKPKDGTEWLDTTKEPISNDEKVSTIVKHKLKGLAHGTQYLARVILLTTVHGQSYRGHKIPEVAFTTDCEEPKSNEYTLSASRLPKGGGIQVSWQYPSVAGACQISSYEVHVKGGWRWNVYRFPAATLKRPEVNITDLLPGHTYRVRVRGVTANASTPFSSIVRVTAGGATAPARVWDLHMASPEEGSLNVVWDAPRFSPAGAIKRYDVRYQCVALLACPDLDCPGEEVNKTVRSGLALTLPVSDLLGHALYRLWVLPVGKGENDVDLPGDESSIVFETPAKATTALAVEVPQNPALNTETSVTVLWRRPDEAKCVDMSGTFVDFRCEISGPPGDAPRTVDTPQTFAMFGNLKPATDYKVKVFVRTSAGVNNESYITLDVKTHSPSPGEVTYLKVYSMRSSKDNSTLSLRWKSPQWDFNADYTEEPFVDIDRYVVEYSVIGGDDKAILAVDVPADDRCSAWQDHICHQITGLAKNTTYRVQVRAVSKDGKFGPPAKVEAITSEGAPGTPSHLKLVSSTSDSITLSVGIPDMLNGVLKRFMVVAERVTEESEEVLDLGGKIYVREELPEYEYTLTNLKADSKYSIRVMAGTKSSFGKEYMAEMKTKKLS